jgi:hypothetical protein
MSAGSFPANAASKPRPAAAFTTALAAAGKRLADRVDTAWAVYSTVDLVARTITNGWADNAFDTMRKRGAGPSARTTFTGV